MRALVWIAAAAGLALAADDEDARRLPEGPGKDAVVKVCLSCHGSPSFRKLRQTKDGWTEKVADMVDRGAQPTDAEAAAIVDYLARTFGDGSGINVNTAPFEELKSVLKLTNQEAQSVAAWRKEKGEFKSVEELEKVPGLDANKIESQKELIQF